MAKWIGMVAGLAALAGLIVWWWSAGAGPGPSLGPLPAARLEPGPRRGGTPPVVRAAPSAAADAGLIRTEEMFPGDGALVIIVTRAGAPVPGAEVRLHFDPFNGYSLESEWRRAGGGTTGPDGQVRLDARSGRYLVGIQAPDAWLQTTTFKLPTEHELTVRIELSAAIALHGRIVDKATGAPIASAEVRWGRSLLASERQLVRSDPSGHFALLGLAAQPIALEVRAPGYVPQAPALELGPKTPPLEIRLARLSRITGVVRALSMRPVPGALVTASSYLPCAAVVSDLEGRFSLDCPPGSYLIAAEKEGAVSLLRHLTLEPGRPSEPIELILRPGGAIEGEVLSLPGREPIAGAAVALKLTSPPGEPVRLVQTTTDAAGHFEFSQLPPGGYEARVKLGGRCAGRELSVAAGKRERLDFELELPGWIEGVVVDPADRPLPHLVVSLRTSPSGAPGACPGEIADTRTDEAGEFRFEGVSPGPGLLQARYPIGLDGTAERTTIAPGAGSQARLVLGALGKLRGAVRLKGGGVVPPEVRVQIAGRHSGQIHSIALEGGHYSLRVPPGEYRLEPGHRVGHLRMLHGGPSHRVEAGRETVVDLELAAPEAKFALEGRVLDATGAPTRAFLSHMMESRGSGWSTQSDGSFRISGEVAEVPNGITLQASTDLASSAVVRVTDFTQPVVLQLRPGRRIEGRVRDGRLLLPALRCGLGGRRAQCICWATSTAARIPNPPKQQPRAIGTVRTPAVALPGVVSWTRAMPIT